MSKTIFSIDVEKDLHGNGYKSITIGLKNLEKICDKNNVKPVLFVTGDCLGKYPALFKRYAKKGWEISSHGHTHSRFDEISLKEKEKEIKDTLRVFKSKLKIKPKGFRAPQHSIDDATLDLLEKNGFEYDSSYTPLNLLQLFFFPRKLKLWVKTFFSPLNPYKIRKNLWEVPCSSMFLPFVSLSVRVFPAWLNRAYYGILRVFYKKPVFYAHSWDFIEMPQSKIDNWFGHERFIRKLDLLMYHASSHNK